MVDTTPAPFGAIARLFNPPPVVSVLRLAGTIGRMAPRRADIGMHELDDAIRRAFRPRRLAAVALAVNSPGGVGGTVRPHRQSHPCRSRRTRRQGHRLL